MENFIILGSLGQFISAIAMIVLAILTYLS